MSLLLIFQFVFSKTRLQWSIDISIIFSSYWYFSETEDNNLGYRTHCIKNNDDDNILLYTVCYSIYLSLSLVSDHMVLWYYDIWTQNNRAYSCTIQRLPSHYVKENHLTHIPHPTSLYVDVHREPAERIMPETISWIWSTNFENWSEMIISPRTSCIYAVQPCE